MTVFVRFHVCVWSSTCGYLHIGQFANWIIVIDMRRVDRNIVRFLLFHSIHCRCEFYAGSSSSSSMKPLGRHAHVAERPRPVFYRFARASNMRTRTPRFISTRSISRSIEPLINNPRKCIRFDNWFDAYLALVSRAACAAARTRVPGVCSRSQPAIDRRTPAGGMKNDVRARAPTTAATNTNTKLWCFVDRGVLSSSSL